MQKEKDVKLAIELGSELAIQIEGIEEKFRAFLIGMEPPIYLIIRMQLASEFRKQIDKGTMFDVRYVSMGNVYGFRSTSLGSTTFPFKVTFLSYPETIETLNLRKEQRVSCYIPASAVLNDLELRGVVTDISTGGIRFTIISENVELRKVKVNNSVSLSFPLLGMEGIQSFQGRVKSLNSGIMKLSFGVEFINLNTMVGDKIDSYVKDVLD